MKKLLIAFCLMLSSTAVLAQSLEDQINLARSAHNTDREALITMNVHFTSAEGEAFWPIYREYRKAMKLNGDLRLALIQEFAASYQELTDDQALSLLSRSENIQQDRLDTRRTYADRFAEVLPGKKVARIMQMEGKLDTAIDMRLAAEIPLVKER